MVIITLSMDRYLISINPDVDIYHNTVIHNARLPLDKGALDA